MVRDLLGPMPEGPLELGRNRMVGFVILHRHCIIRNHTRPRIEKERPDMLKAQREGQEHACDEIRIKVGCPLFLRTYPCVPEVKFNTSHNRRSFSKL